jgi:hypothetical protein
MAAVTQIDGIKRVLQELYYLDRSLHKTITGRMRTAAQPIADYVGSLFPDSDALSGWEASASGQRTKGGFPKYYGPSARKGVKVRTGGRVNRLTGMAPIVKLVQTDPAGAVFDISGRLSTRGSHPNFIPNLRGKQGEASRAMWPGVLSKFPAIESEIRAAVAEAEKVVNKSLAAGAESRTAKQSAFASARGRTSLGRFGVRGI